MSPSDTTVRTLLREARRLAVVGLSPQAGRPSHGVTRYMQAQGYEIFGVRPGTREILGRPCYAILAEVPPPIDIVNVFRAPEFVPDIVDAAIVCGARALWLQEGVTHPAAEERARQAGLIVISDRCILKEHMRLGV